MSRRGRPGGPSTLLRDQLTTLLECLEQPWYTKESACLAAGIGYSTFLRWMAKGKAQRSGEYRDFREQVRGAEAKAKLTVMKAISRAGLGTPKRPGDWRAMLRLAQVRWFREFADRKISEKTVKGDASAPIPYTFVPAVPPPVGAARRPPETAHDDEDEEGDE